MNIMIEIDSTNVRERHINSDKGNFTARDQIGWLQLPGKRYPQEIVVSLEEGRVPYAVGTYRLLEDSVGIDRFKHVTFQRALQLELVTEEKIKAVDIH